MIKIMADNNADGHVKILVGILLSDAWIEFWNELELTLVTFEDLGIHRDAIDTDLWKMCQREQIILITSNRNADGPDSLETVIREENRNDSLLVFTLADAKRIGYDRDYVERTAISLLQYLIYLDESLGAGRIYIP